MDGLTWENAGQILRGAMSTVAEALGRRADLDPRHRRMAEAIIEVVENLRDVEPASERQGWLTFANALIEAVDRGDPMDDMIERGYREVLFLRSGARDRALSEETVLMSRADIEKRLAG